MNLRLKTFIIPFLSFTGGSMPKSDEIASDYKMKIPVYELKFWTVHCLSSSYYVMFLQLNSVVTLTVFPSRLLPALPCRHVGIGGKGGNPSPPPNNLAEIEAKTVPLHGLL